MDPRIREQARVIVDHCTGVSRGDDVAILAQPPADDLVVALNELCGERGAITYASLGSTRARRAYRRAVDEADVGRNDMLLALLEEADVCIVVGAATNAFEESDVPTAVNRALASANKPLQEAQLESRWCYTKFPTRAGAQRAEMSTEAYEDFVFGAVNKDWDAVAARLDRLVDRLRGADEVRIRSGETADVTMSIAGNVVKNDVVDADNLPAGEVFTAPVPDSVEGEVLFDKPVLVQGREVLDVRLVFEGGEVVDHAARKNEDVLTSLLGTDDGARRLGELGIGMNRDIDRFTYDMLFDEKMGDTVHLALGMAYEDTVGEGNERNDSAVHADMLVDMSEESVIEVDGEVLQRDGTFRWEDGFEG